MKANSGLVDEAIERVLELSADGQFISVARQPHFSRLSNGKSADL